MTAALRKIQPWLPLLQRPRTISGHRAAVTDILHLLPGLGAARPRQVKPLIESARRFAGNGAEFGSGRRSGSSVTEEEDQGDDEEELIDDSEVEELFQQQIPAGIGQGQHRVFIVHPDVKWGSRKQHLTTGIPLFLWRIQIQWLANCAIVNDLISLCTCPSGSTHVRASVPNK